MRTLTKILIALIALFPALINADTNPVARAVITTAIDSQAEPVSNLSTVDSTVGNVMFYTEVVGLSGTTIAHRWLYEGRTIATINMVVRGNSSRTWSRTSITAKQLGKWEAQVLDASGNLLAARQFEVTRPHARTVQTRVIQKYNNDCDDKVIDLQQQLEKDPASPYLQFLLKQQTARCD